MRGDGKKALVGGCSVEEARGKSDRVSRRAFRGADRNIAELANHTKPKPHSKHNTESRSKLGMKPRAKPAVKPAVKLEVKLKVKPSVKPNVRSKARSKARREK